MTKRKKNRGNHSLCSINKGERSGEKAKGDENTKSKSQYYRWGNPEVVLCPAEGEVEYFPTPENRVGRKAVGGRAMNKE